jgi:hypothetical protein
VLRGTGIAFELIIEVVDRDRAEGLGRIVVVRIQGDLAGRGDVQGDREPAARPRRVHRVAQVREDRAEGIVVVELDLGGVVLGVEPVGVDRRGVPDRLGDQVRTHRTLRQTLVQCARRGDDQILLVQRLLREVARRFFAARPAVVVADAHGTPRRRLVIVAGTLWVFPAGTVSMLPWCRARPYSNNAFTRSLYSVKSFAVI